MEWYRYLKRRYNLTEYTYQQESGKLHLRCSSDSSDNIHPFDLSELIEAGLQEREASLGCTKLTVQLWAVRTYCSLGSWLTSFGK